MQSRWARLALAAAIAVALLLVWLASTDDVRVWPARNTLVYRAVTAWWSLAGPPRYGEVGTVTGIVRDTVGKPIAGARVALTAWDGTAYHGRTGVDGTYRIESVPTGPRYSAVAGAAGHADVSLGRVSVVARRERALHAALPPEEVETKHYGGVSVTLRTPVTSTSPIEARATRWELFYFGPTRFARPAQGAKLFLYVPEGTTEQSRALPLLLTAYPGPAEEWESASVPLAAAGFGVLAYGPPYGFEPERAVSALVGLVHQARDGRMPGIGGSRIAVLAGSYSGLHALRVLQEEHANPSIKAAVLMGAPTDLFDMRRRLEDRSFVPPFGLDQALVAQGFPDREPLRYWRYSGAYHVRRGMPATLLIHSRQDDVVPYQQSELLARTLGEEGVPHELHLLDGGTHYLLSAEREARQIYELTVRFLRERLG